MCCVGVRLQCFVLALGITKDMGFVVAMLLQ